MATYDVKEEVEIDGTSYAAGEKVELDESAAASLVEEGKVALAEAPEEESEEEDDDTEEEEV